MKKNFERIFVFLKEVGVQVKKIDWPLRKQAFDYTLIVLGISLVTALILGFLDFLFFKILSRFFYF